MRLGGVFFSYEPWGSTSAPPPPREPSLLSNPEVFTLPEGLGQASGTTLEFAQSLINSG